MDYEHYERMHAEYLRLISDRSREAYLRGLKEGLSTNWRWRLYFWLQDWLNKRA